MAKGFGYKYSEGKVHFTIKYGPIIAGLVVNGEWRRIQFRHIEAGANAIKSIEKANMYEQFMGYMNKLEEVPDEYFMTLYDGHLGPYIKDYIPSDVKREEFGKVRVSKTSLQDLAIENGVFSATEAVRYPWPTVDGGLVGGRSTARVAGPNASIPYTIQEYEAQLRAFEASRYLAPPAPTRDAWLRGDWVVERSPIPSRTIPVAFPSEGTSDTLDYPIDRAIENMRGTEQERARSEQQQRLMNELDNYSRRLSRRTI